MRKNILKTLGRQVLVAFIQLASVIMIARNYGVEGNGIYSVALLLPQMLSTFFNLGISSSNTYFIASKKIGVQQSLFFSLKIGSILSCIGGVVGLLCIFYRELLFPSIDLAFLVIALISFPFIMIQGYISAIFLGKELFNTFNAISIVQPCLFFIIVLFLYIYNQTQLSWLLYAYLATVIASFTLYLFNLLLHIKNNPSELIDFDSKEVPKKTIMYGIKSHLSNILSFINYRADLILVNFFISPIAAGLYIISIQLVEKLWLLSQAISTVVLPRLASIDNNEDSKVKLTLKACKLVFYLTLISSFLLAIVVYPFVSVLFGKVYLDAVIPIVLLLPGVVFGAISRILANDIASRGRPELNMYGSIVTVIVNVIGNIVLIPIYGIKGAALATSIAYILNFFTRYYNFNRIVNVKLLSLFSVSRIEFFEFKNSLTSYRK